MVLSEVTEGTITYNVVSESLSRVATFAKDECPHTLDFSESCNSGYIELVS